MRILFNHEDEVQHYDAYKLIKVTTKSYNNVKS